MSKSYEFNFPKPLPFGKIQNDLELNTPYRITNHEVFNTEYGETIVITLENNTRYNLPPRYCKQLLQDNCLYKDFFEHVSHIVFKGMVKTGRFEYTDIDFITSSTS